MHHVRVPLKLDKSFSSACFRHACLSSVASHNQYEQSQLVTNLSGQGQVAPTVHEYACWLKDCTRGFSLIQGHGLHAAIIDEGLEAHPVIGSALVNMYSKCGSLEDACKVFDMVSVRDVVLWSAIIVACANHRHAEKGLCLFERMQLEEGFVLDKRLLVYVLKACAGMSALEEGRRTHLIITKQGLDADQFVGNGLVDMYCKCGNIEDAHVVFDNFTIRDVVFWTAMISGYVESSLNAEALKLFCEMHEQGVAPNIITYECAIRACSSLGAVQEGKELFADMTKLGIYDSHVGAGLVRMFCNCGNLNDAHKVFITLKARDVVSWTVLISGYAEQGRGEEALTFYQNMRKGGVKPDEAIFICVIKVCSQMGALREGQLLYLELMLEGLDTLLSMKQSLMDMFIKCASLQDAHTIFESLPVRDVVSWSAIITGCALHGYHMKCLELFEDMQSNGIQPNEITVPTILKACASLKRMDCGKLLHNHLVVLGLENDHFSRSTLIHMYASGRRMEEACNVFNQLPQGGDDVVWNTMIGTYVEHKQKAQALHLYAQMCHQGKGSGYVTLLWIIRACSDVEQGRLIYALAVKQGYDKYNEVQNTVIGMYSKMGRLDDAYAIFNSLAVRTMGSYNAILLGHSLFGPVEKALQIYCQMNGEGIEQDQNTQVSMLKICAATGGMYIGRLIHAAIAQNAWDYDPFLASSLIDFFSKAGSLRDAVNVFNRLCLPDAVSWNTLIAAYADHGCIEDVQKSFMVMQEEGVEPSSRTFSSLLNACSHAGIPALSYYYICTMRDYGIVPNPQHFTCLIDALVRAGLLSEAEMLTLKMPMNPLIVVSTALLGSPFKQGLLDQELRVTTI